MDVIAAVAKNEDGSLHQHTLDGKQFPPIRDWAPGSIGAWRTSADGSSNRIYVDRSGHACEVQVSPAAVAGMYEVLDFQFWVDKANNVRAMIMNKNVTMQVTRQVGEFVTGVHLGEAYGWKRATVKDLERQRALYEKNAAADAERIAAREPGHANKEMFKAIAEVSKENMRGVVAEAVGAAIKEMRAQDAENAKKK